MCFDWEIIHIWSLDIINKKMSFPSVEIDSKDIVWHESVFIGFEEGIVDRGGSEQLANIASWDEINDIHSLIRDDVNNFFNTPGAVWYYTGKIGGAPDFIGVKENVMMIGEIKWREGWAVRLYEQIQRYACGEKWIGNLEDNELKIFIACPQTASRILINNIVGLCRDRCKTKTFAKWKSMNVYFGFMQLGWLQTDNTKYFFRVVWAPGEFWNGESFNNIWEKIGLHDAVIDRKWA